MPTWLPRIRGIAQAHRFSPSPSDGFFACWIPGASTGQQRPIMDARPQPSISAKSWSTSSIEPFNLYLKVGMMAACSWPRLRALQLWCFISPAVPARKALCAPFMVSTIGLFLAGVYFGYKVVCAGAGISDRLWQRLQPMITLTEYSLCS